MELSKENFIKLKQKEYYLSKYKKNNIKNLLFFIKTTSNQRLETLKGWRIINKYNLNIKFSYLEMLGCSRNEFKQYIIDNLLEGMSLKNFGEWEMDHTIPISSFKFESLNEIKTCFNFKNIKPMWKSDNRHKFNKI